MRGPFSLAPRPSAPGWPRAQAEHGPHVDAVDVIHCASVISSTKARPLTPALVEQDVDGAELGKRRCNDLLGASSPVMSQPRVAMRCCRMAPCSIADFRPIDRQHLRALVGEQLGDAAPMPEAAPVTIAILQSVCSWRPLHSTFTPTPAPRAATAPGPSPAPRRRPWRPAPTDRRRTLPRRSRVSGVSEASTKARSSWRMTTRGVPAGAITPTQTTTSAVGQPASAIVGTSGSNGDRALVVTASGRNLPDATMGAAEAVLVNMACSWPACRSASAGAASIGHVHDVDIGREFQALMTRFEIVPTPGGHSLGTAIGPLPSRRSR